MPRILIGTAILCLSSWGATGGPSGIQLAQARTIHVPQDCSTIQSAVDAAEAGDTIVVAPGTYRERIILKSGIRLKSAGDDKPGALGLSRAEATLIDGSSDSSEPGQQAGVTMAAGATLDGFTITGVGTFNEQEWQRHHATQGNDQHHEQIGGPGVPGISIEGVDCDVRHNIVHHIGYAGIAIRGLAERQCVPRIVGNVCYRNMGAGISSQAKSAAIIENNICFENFYAGIGLNDSSPVISGNTCHSNIRAGIGISAGSCPVVQGNSCYRNRRSGIGARTLATTRPCIRDNDCYENDMAGIGVEEHAAPLLSQNRCYRNRLAGIGCRDHASPTMIENECYENGTAGIGHESDANSTLIRNHCHANQEAGIGFTECARGQSTLIENRILNNAKVAVGIHSGWTVTALRNHMAREKGIPPIVMIFAGARGTFIDNRIEGGGIAGIRVAGELSATGNSLRCPNSRNGGPPSNAIWALDGSKVTLADNEFEGWRVNIAGEVTSLD